MFYRAELHVVETEGVGRRRVAGFIVLLCPEEGGCWLVERRLVSIEDISKFDNEGRPLRMISESERLVDGGVQEKVRR